TLEKIPAKRRIVVLGDIDAPPPPERPHYREVGRRVAAVADYVLFIGHKYDRFRPGLRAGGMADERFRRVEDVQEAVAALREMIGPGDVVLVKGREGQRLTRIILALNGRNVRCNVDPCRLHLT